VLGVKGSEVIGPRLPLAGVDAGLYLDQQHVHRIVVGKKDDHIDTALGGEQLPEFTRTDLGTSEGGEGQGAGALEELDGEEGVGAEEFDEFLVLKRRHRRGE
jgi:hypothetical protein